MYRGRNVTIEYRWAEDRIERYAAMRSRSRPPPGRRDRRARIASRASGQGGDRDDPVVFAVANPVRLGLVASLARPGGNPTGINVSRPELYGKRLESCSELAPNVARVPCSPIRPIPPERRDNHSAKSIVAARAMGLQIEVLNASTSRRDRGGLHHLLGANGPTRSSLHRALHYRSLELASLPGGTAPIPFGFLLPRLGRSRRIDELWPNFRKCIVRRRLHRPHPQGREAGGPAGEQATKFELVINLKTARALGLEVPASLLLAPTR